MASLVSAMSVMTPSVRINRMKYCCEERAQTSNGKVFLCCLKSLMELFVVTDKAADDKFRFV